MFPEEISLLLEAPYKCMRKRTPRALEKADVYALFLRLLWDTWGRAFEVLHIEIENIDLDRRTILFEKVKRKVSRVTASGKKVTERQPRTVSFSEEAKTLLVRVIRFRNRGFLFSRRDGTPIPTKTIRDVVHRYAVQLGIQRVTGNDKNNNPKYLVHPHALREAGEAYAIIFGSMDRKVAAMKAGHSERVQEQYYLKYNVVREMLASEQARRNMRNLLGGNSLRGIP